MTDVIVVFHFGHIYYIYNAQNEKQQFIRIHDKVIGHLFIDSMSLVNQETSPWLERENFQI